jgi:uncharacterized membrane protein
MMTEWKSRDFLAITLFLQLIAVAMIIFDVPVARQIIGFIYFSFVPGFLIIKLLKIDELDELETVLFSVGLSVAFLMLAGLVINEFGFLFGILKPLSLIPLTIFFNSLILLCGVLVYLRGENVKLFRAETFRLSPLALLLIVLPILSIVGAIWVDTYESNLILLTVISAIALLFAVGIISKKVLPPKLYPLALLLIAIALLFHSLFISKYLITFGSDVANEYFVFKTTETNAHWSSISSRPGDPFYGRLNSMLGITILPTIYSVLLNMNATQILKIIYPLIFSFVPLSLYQLWQKNFGKKTAFAAAFLLMAPMTFYTEMMGLSRQIIAELFFVLLLLVVLNKNMKSFNKMICFIIFSVALVTSHYALGELFLIFLSIAVISLFLMKKQSRNITVTMAVIFFVIMFSWYVFTSNSAAFDSFVSFGNYVINQAGEFFNLASRGETVLRGLGLESAPSIWNLFSRVFAYLTEIFIVLGFVALITRRTDFKLEREQFILTVIAGAFLVALIAVPGLAETMRMTRFYHILLFFLAPLCAIGAELLVKFIFKQKRKLSVSILLVIVLVPYFLFQTGFIYEVTRSESWSLPLSNYRMDDYRLYYSFGYIDDWSVFSAQWMHKNTNIQSTQVYADLSSIGSVLPSYGSLYGGTILPLSNITSVQVNGTVYLGPLNILNETIATSTYIFALDELSFLDNMNKIYTNGGSEVYRNRVKD